MDNKISQISLLHGNNPIWLSTCHSTNEFLKDLIKTHEFYNGFTICAKAQTAGKGQMGTVWESEPFKNLTFSTIYYPHNFQLSESFYISCAVSLGISDCLISNGYIPTIKWPNDILIGTKKVSGILIETQSRDSILKSFVAGIGLNVNQQVFVNQNATSLILTDNKQYNLEILLADILKFLNQRIETLQSGDYVKLREDYYARMYLRNKIAAFKSGENTFMGIIRGVDPSGKLIIECDEGNRYFQNKEVVLLK